MTEVKKQESVRREVERHNDRIREWEEELPSLADLISLSQCLISPQLASAFSITSPPPFPTCSFGASLPCTSQARPDLLVRPDAIQATPHPPSLTGDIKDPHLLAGGAQASHVNPRRPLHRGDCSPHVIDASEGIHGCYAQTSDERYPAHFTSLDAEGRSNGGGASVREWYGISQPADPGHHRKYGADTSVGKVYGSYARSNGYGGDVLKEDEDGAGEGGGCVHAKAPCISDSSDEATQDREAEEDESADWPAENANEETVARTLKRPRLVWTPELHKRFVDAVSHLGVKTAVPKTIMQLMNVEGLTRENVASHLQKYRLYLKRMQGLLNEGPTSSDHLFASTPLPANLVAAGRFHTGMPRHLQQEIRQVPFAPSNNPVSMGRGHVAGIMSGPLPAMDPYSFNMFARPLSHRFLQGDLQDVPAFRRPHSALFEHILKK